MTNQSSSTPSSPADQQQHPSSWIWMKDAKSRIGNPIDLVDEYDHRPAVHTLIAKHRDGIHRMKEKLRTRNVNAQLNFYNEEKHDDLWLLRFLLSQGKEDKAVEAAQSTLVFRQEHSLDEYDLRPFSVTAASLQEHASELPPFAQSAAKMLECYDDDHTLLYSIPDDRRGVIGFLVCAKRNQHKMAEQLETDDYFGAHLLFTEWKFQWMDYLTRTTGRLTKYLSIADFDGVHRKMIHKESKKKDSAAAKIMEDKYPQLLGSMIIVHAPTWMSIVFAILKPFAPKRMMEKVTIIKLEKKHKHDLERLFQYVAVENLPEQYGGKLQGWPPATIPLPVE